MSGLLVVPSAEHARAFGVSMPPGFDFDPGLVGWPLVVPVFIAKFLCSVNLDRVVV